MTVEEVAEVVNDWVEEFNIHRVVLTGGEPMMQQQEIIELIKLTSPFVSYDIETNGTIAPLDELTHLVDTFVISPKLTHSGDILKKRIKEKALFAFADLAFNGQAIFKFVAQKPEDLDEVAEIALHYGIDQNDIWIMPEGESREKQLFRTGVANIQPKVF